MLENILCMINCSSRNLERHSKKLSKLLVANSCLKSIFALTMQITEEYILYMKQ